MSCEKPPVTRSNFASRLLNKAMSERSKTSEMQKPILGEPDKTIGAVETKEAISTKS